MNDNRELKEIVFRTDLYPRIQKSMDTVEQYKDSLDSLPPIEVNQHNELIDGWHRWTAHKSNGTASIPVIVTKTTSEAHFLELAIERNAKHGLQLSQEDKQKMAWRLYVVTPEKERPAKKVYLQKLLSVAERTIRGWLADIDKKTEEEQRETAFNLWLQCRTQQEIADAMEVPQQTVSDWIKSFTEIGNIAGIGKNAQNRATFNDGIDADGEPYWKPPLYNVWTTRKLTNTVKHYGNSEQRWVENLIYLYTDPLDVVIDPFAGGGSTIDVCKKRLRRYLVSDRLPVENRPEIRDHDIADGPLKPPQWQDVRLVYLDPPYWKQAEGQYSTDKEDMANMELEEFTTQLAKTIKTYAGKMTAGYIALIIQPTQWKAEGKQFTDHIRDMLCAIKLPVECRISAPYSTEQYNAQQVEWAKSNKKLLVISREIIVWRVE